MRGKDAEEVSRYGGGIGKTSFLVVIGLACRAPALLLLLLGGGFSTLRLRSLLLALSEEPVPAKHCTRLKEGPLASPHPPGNPSDALHSRLNGVLPSLIPGALPSPSASSSHEEAHRTPSFTSRWKGEKSFSGEGVGTYGGGDGTVKGSDADAPSPSTTAPAAVECIVRNGAREALPFLSPLGSVGKPAEDDDDGAACCFFFGMVVVESGVVRGQ